MNGIWQRTQFCFAFQRERGLRHSNTGSMSGYCAISRA